MPLTRCLYLGFKDAIVTSYINADIWNERAGLTVLKDIEDWVKLSALFLEASILLREASIEAILLLSKISLENSEFNTRTRYIRYYYYYTR